MTTQYPRRFPVRREVRTAEVSGQTLQLVVQVRNAALQTSVSSTSVQCASITVTCHRNRYIMSTVETSGECQRACSAKTIEFQQPIMTMAALERSQLLDLFWLINL